MAIGPDGTSYAVWQDSRSGNADICFASMPAGGSAWAADESVNRWRSVSREISGSDATDIDAAETALQRLIEVCSGQ